MSNIYQYENLKGGLVKWFNEVEINDTVVISNSDVVSINSYLINLQTKRIYERANELNAQIITWADDPSNYKLQFKPNPTKKK